MLTQELPTVATETALIVPGDGGASPEPSVDRALAVAQEGGGEPWRGHHFKIPGDKMAVATKDLPEEQRDALRWLFGFCRDRDLADAALGQLLLKNPDRPASGFYHADSIKQTLTGKRMEESVNLAPFVASVLAFRKKVEMTSRAGDSGFIEIRMSKEIFKRLHNARAKARILFVWGESQIGKTETGVEYARQFDHGNTIMMEAPTGGTLILFLEALAEKCSIPRQLRLADMMRRIIEYFDSKMLLIVDEAHRLMKTASGIKCLDFLRMLYNQAKCGMAIFMTNEGRDLFKSGPHTATLKQLWRRRIQPLQLPDVLPKDDLDKFAIAYGLPPATMEDVTVQTPCIDGAGRAATNSHKKKPAELEALVNREEGLGLWLSLLQSAKDEAQRLRRKISWAAVIKAYAVDQAEGEEWE